MVIHLSFLAYQSMETNNNASNEKWAKEANKITLIIGVPMNTIIDYPVNYKNRKAIKLLQTRLVLYGIFALGRNLNLPNFWAKKWENLIQFLFHKKQKGKNFFLEKN
ncbi:MAG TPA: hypothetical protein VIV35_03720 [Chitinophagaceae bacterium]